MVIPLRAVAGIGEDIVDMREMGGNKMKLKRLAAIFLVFVLALSMAACGGTASSSGSGGGAGTKPTKAPEDMKVALVMRGAIRELGWDLALIPI